MPAEPTLSEELLDPISPDQPAGSNLRWLPEWDRIKEARQSEDGLAAGKWVKREQKTANWRLVKELSRGLLESRSKDLQLAMWLTEAGLKLDGFIGLRDGLKLSHDLIDRFWDVGLFPVMEDGPEDRTGPFEWLNEKVVDSLLAIPVTRSTEERDYGLVDLRDARLVGSEGQCKGDDGDIDPQKKREYDKALASGRISLEMFESAVRETPRHAYEELYSEFEQAAAEFTTLEKTIDEKFGDVAPNLSAFRTALADIREEMSKILERKRREEPDPSIRPDHAPGSSPTGQETTLRFPLSSLHASNSGGADAWRAAERLVRSGQIDNGLAEMRRLAAAESTGRSRFERKLLLAEVCLASRRERLARAILVELAEQIDTHHLEAWEGSELISGVWSRLYELYKSNGSTDADDAAKLYDRLCRLDPWQALTCSE